MPEARLAMAVAMAEEEAQEEKGIAPAPAPRIDAALPLQDFDWKLKVCIGSEFFITVMWFVSTLSCSLSVVVKQGYDRSGVFLDANHALWFGFRGPKFWRYWIFVPGALVIALYCLGYGGG